MTRTPRVHLQVGSKVACGLKDPRVTTTTPSSVTCVPCKKTIHMADAEAKEAIRRRRL